MGDGGSPLFYIVPYKATPAGFIENIPHHDVPLSKKLDLTRHTRYNRVWQHDVDPLRCIARRPEVEVIVALGQAGQIKINPPRVRLAHDAIVFGGDLNGRTRTILKR